MSYNELTELIKKASAVKERKKREKKDAEWGEFSKAWNKIFKENEDIDLGCETYTLSEVFEELEEIFYAR